jgi:hypothetical protein
MASLLLLSKILTLLDFVEAVSRISDLAGPRTLDCTAEERAGEHVSNKQQGVESWLKQRIAAGSPRGN